MKILGISAYYHDAAAARVALRHDAGRVLACGRDTPRVADIDGSTSAAAAEQCHVTCIRGERDAAGIRVADQIIKFLRRPGDIEIAKFNKYADLAANDFLVA